MNRSLNLKNISSYISGTYRFSNELIFGLRIIVMVLTYVPVTRRIRVRRPHKKINGSKFILILNSMFDVIMEDLT